MQAMWRVYLVSAVLSCVVAVGTTLVTVRLVAPASDHTVVLEGVAELHRSESSKVPYEELEVFYKSPFAGPPHLTFPDGLPVYVNVADQKTESFKLRRVRTDLGPRVLLKWKAEGQPAK